MKEKHSFSAIHLLDDERSVSCSHYRTQVFCRKCGFMVNDDLNNDAQHAYAQLAEQVGASRVRPADVAKAVEEARKLPTLPDAARQRDYDLVREFWGCAGMHVIPADQLEDALAKVVRGYFAEGAYRVTVETLEQGVLMLSFSTATGFRPVRLARGTGGDFVVYGQIQLYRILGVV
ncbi:hypothetical protein ALI144C_03770 [Actinosynnema sp. ALI-1.44]|uniref:hypothetical protein n=1 Tax=Actinosynnema sp. ALI-1.44 TaxID=1933779 RepID=UPI00097C97B8|nr:hypothetical protein [Actinosynnema sp. ALI-1.44]ONI90143.1 hypothetical protein ALI144C_03770 [Actinosynnema sp. ALI-1.44]